MAQALKRKPIQVWIKQTNTDWRCLFDTDSPPDARDYARDRISYRRGNNVQRVEIRDRFGEETLEVVYDKRWGHQITKGSGEAEE